jgi:hypothetical protein
LLIDNGYEECAISAYRFFKYKIRFDGVVEVLAKCELWGLIRSAIENGSISLNVQNMSNIAKFCKGKSVTLALKKIEGFDETYFAQLSENLDESEQKFLCEKAAM